MDTLWNVEAIRITSVSVPFGTQPLMAAAIALVRRAAGAGLLTLAAPVETIDLGLIRSVAREASRAGIGMDAAVALLGDRVDDDPARLATLVARLEAAIAASPLPGPELGVLRGVYPDPLLADLLGISEVSLRRYAAGDIIFHEGQRARDAYLIVRGQVELLKNRPGGRVRLALLSAGQIFGEMGVINRTTRSAT